MNPADYAVLAFLILIACLNAIVSFRLFAADDLDRVQKICQVIVVWVFPLLGALLVLAVFRTGDSGAMPARLRSQIDGDGFDGANDYSSSLGSGHSGHGGDSGGGHGH